MFCHKEAKVGGGYTCPRCKARVCELPTECQICGLALVSSPHLARTYHHLFPVMPFNEVSQILPIRLQQKLPQTCFGCQQSLLSHDVCGSSCIEQVTAKSKYSVHLVQDLLDQLYMTTRFTKPDLWSGYWQVRAAARNRVEATYVTQYDSFEFLFMLFGLTNAFIIFCKNQIQPPCILPKMQPAFLPGL
ncbi:hypothetical protein HPP92_015146 [Vanilla planifolia]|uniref:Uncharacterized protein n=1 Tax=Vanilla planifolia TaxID=51239 RepID=A0A835URS2_VANPL|nr:hypothetical protein HPP92_015146 [Vanilla planifolia]